MKRIVSLMLALLVVMALSSCGESKSHEGEVKAPFDQNSIKKKNYQEIVSEFEKAGFTNIKTEKIPDLVTGWLTKDGEVESVSIGGNQEYKTSEWFKHNVEVKIAYHTFPEEEVEKPEEEKEQSKAMDTPETAEPTPSKEETTEVEEPIETAEETAEESQAAEEPPVTIENFPEEMARRAAVVAFTNFFATDVFKEDRSTIDPSKFHSFSDISGYHMIIKSKGTWTVKNENTWHVKHLIISPKEYGTIFDVNLDVSYDGEKYVVSNVSGKGPSYPDISEIETYSDFQSAFTVSPELVESGR